MVGVDHVARVMVRCKWLWTRFASQQVRGNCQGICSVYVSVSYRMLLQRAFTRILDKVRVHFLSIDSLGCGISATLNVALIDGLAKAN